MVETRTGDVVTKTSLPELVLRRVQEDPSMIPGISWRYQLEAAGRVCMLCTFAYACLRKQGMPALDLQAAGHLGMNERKRFMYIVVLISLEGRNGQPAVRRVLGSNTW